MSALATAALFAMMLALGMTLRPQDFRRVLALPVAVGFGLLGQLVLLPLVGFGLAHALALPHTLAVGLVLIAACPGGATSNVLSWLARGDVALSITLTALSSLVSFAWVPFLVSLALRAFGGDAPRLALSLAEMMAKLFTTTALPVGLGMLALHLHPRGAGRLRGPLLGGATAVLLLLVAGLAYGTWSSGRDLAALTRQGAPAVVLLVIFATGIGLAGGRALRVGAAASRTLGLEIGIQNFNLALVVGVSLLDEPRYVGPAILYLPVMLIVAGAVAALGCRSPAPREVTAREAA